MLLDGREWGDDMHLGHVWSQQFYVCAFARSINMRNDSFGTPRMQQQRTVLCILLFRSLARSAHYVLRILVKST
jgi:hypothetical protein